jgi:membrane protease YdiL (CAAX protease family)
LSLFFNNPVVRDAEGYVPTDLLPGSGAVVRTVDGRRGPCDSSGLPHFPADLAWCTALVEPASGGGRMLPLARSINGPAARSLMADVVTGVGAGIYEELVFRLILICALMVLFQDVIGIDHKNAVILSVLISAALFSAHHHHITFIDGQLGRGAPFSLAEFTFRTAAGVYFAGLFAIRGFGITAGTHAFYDIIATVINALFFAYH